MIKILFSLLIFSLLWLSAETIKPKTMHATDHHRHYSRSSGGTHDDPFISTMETSVEITSMVSLEASSDATSQSTSESDNRGNAHISSFINENRIEITQDIAKAEGEHLLTLLSLMKLPSNEKYLLKLQSNFDGFIYLNSDQFLTKLRSVQS